MKWVSSFKYLRINYVEDIASIENADQKVVFYNNISGSKVRVRFSNKYAKRNLVIDEAYIGVIRNGKDIGKEALKVDGKSVVTLEPGQEIFSDETLLEVSAGDKLYVLLHFGQKQIYESICCFWADDGAKVTLERDGREISRDIISEFMKNDPNIHMQSMFIGFDAVQVLTFDETKTIAAFGDSITHMSFYTNALTKRLYNEYFEKVSVINCGIGGNRLINDATFVKAAGKELLLFGEAGVKRFEKDVFEIDDVDAVCVLIGINDIMHPIQLEEKEETISSEDLIQGYRQIIECAHENGAEIFFGTIMPSGNDDYPKWWIEKFEKVRNEVNDWIRKGELHDGYFDFDKALQDANRPGYMRNNMNIGDGLHPNTLGGMEMAKAVDIKTIMGEKKNNL